MYGYYDQVDGTDLLKGELCRHLSMISQEKISNAINNCYLELPLFKIPVSGPDCIALADDKTLYLSRKVSVFYVRGIDRIFL